MTQAIRKGHTAKLRDAVDEALAAVPDVTDNTRAAFARLVDVLESSGNAVVFPAEAMISTTQAATLLGVSRMTVVRLIDHGELHAETSGVHRRIAVSELERYQSHSRQQKRKAMAELAADITAITPPDRVIATR